MRSVAFIGAVGLPNVHGGFEAFLESCAPMMAARGERVTVTCDAARYPDQAQTWQGVHREFIRVPANGGWSVLHDLIAFLRVYRRSRNVVVLGVSGGLFFPLMRGLCALSGQRLLVNVDGVEWRRRKFGRGKRLFLRISDTLAQAFAHTVIVDNRGLYPFLFGPARAKAVYIPYPGDQVKRLPGPVPPGGGFLTVCRIEPENNCELLLQAFASLGRGTYTFVGNWDASRYGRTLRREYGATPGLSLLDPVYDPERIAALRESCTGYLHGHSVGGTNPSLVEMLFYDAPIAAYDCVFNRNTAGASASYFDSAVSLRQIMARWVDAPERGPKPERLAFSRAKILEAYDAVLS